MKSHNQYAEISKLRLLGEEEAKRIQTSKVIRFRKWLHRILSRLIEPLSRPHLVVFDDQASRNYDEALREHREWLLNEIALGKYRPMFDSFFDSPNIAYQPPEGEARRLAGDAG